MRARRLTVTLAILAGLAGRHARADDAAPTPAPTPPPPATPPAPTPARATDCDAATAASLDGDLTRAALLVEACPADSPVRAAIGATVAREHYGHVAIVTHPGGVAVTLDGRGELSLRGGDAVWLAPGAYTFRAGAATTTVGVTADADAIAELDTRAPGAQHELVPRPPTAVTPERRGGLAARVSVAGPAPLITDNRSGWTLGLSARSPEIEHGYFQIDLAWSRLSDPYNTIDGVELPLTVGANLHRTGPVTPSIYFGGELVLPLRNSAGYSTRHFDSGLVGGVEVIGGGARWYALDVRYQRIDGGGSLSLGVAIMLF